MMARKPPALPDVFARPGAAPARGTAIEDLPLPPPEPVMEPEVLMAEPVVEPKPAMPREPVMEPEIPMAPEPVAEPVMPPEPVMKPEPAIARAAAPPPAPPLQAEPPPPAPPIVAVTPKPPAEEPYVPPVAATPAKSAGGRALTLALIALVVSLSAPFWEDRVLSSLGIHTPAGRAVEQGTLAVLQQDRRTEDIAQRLSTATTQMARQQMEFTNAMQRADRAATLIRTMALVRLSDTLRRPMPFAAELAVVRASGTDLGELKPLLDQIEPYADTGIPGTTQLRQDFRALYDPIARGGGGAAQASWMGNLATWTHLRSATPAQPEGAQSLELLRTASARLADIDIAGALEATRGVSDAYKPAFANWMDDAQARVAADSLAERASDMVTQALRPPAPAK